MVTVRQVRASDGPPRACLAGRRSIARCGKCGQLPSWRTVVEAKSPLGRRYSDRTWGEMIQFRGIPVGSLDLLVAEPRGRRRPRWRQNPLRVGPALEEGREGPAIGDQEGPGIRAGVRGLSFARTSSESG